MEKNHVYKIKGDYEYTSKSATKKQLGEARKAAQALIKKTKGVALAMRSCWVCNGAHTHFLKGDWGGWVLKCLGDCGRYYYNRIDITEYSNHKEYDQTKGAERKNRQN